MKKDAIRWEEARLLGVDELKDYRIWKERHRVFPALFEGRRHRRILDVAAGVGCVAQRIREAYPAELTCNEISPTCLKVLGRLGVRVVSFDLDDESEPYPFGDGHFDAVISLVTIEHLLHTEHHLREIHRILAEGGFLYISTPNYAAPEYLGWMLLSGRTFHDPFRPSSRYEFQAHVRYLTFRTLLQLTEACGLVPETVYIALPGGSTRYQALHASSRPLALAYRYAMWLVYHLLSPRWASEPIVCCRKAGGSPRRRLRKVVL